MELRTNLEKCLLKCFKIFENIFWKFLVNLAEILKKLYGNFEKILRKLEISRKFYRNIAKFL